MTINARISEYLIGKGIKQAYIAKRTGMSAKKVSSMLNDKRKISAGEFLDLCEVLNVDPKIFKNS